MGSTPVARHIYSRAAANGKRVQAQGGAKNPIIILPDADVKMTINIGVAAPMAFFPFSGWKNSFFGTLHGQSRHAVEFFTQTKVVVERWPKEWARKF